MLKGMGDLGGMMKMAKEAKGIQKKLKKSLATGYSSDGMVEATLNGEFQMVGININEDFLKSGDKTKIERMIISAVNNAADKSKANAAEEMQKITGGLNIPGLSDMFN